MKPDIGSESRFLPTPSAFNAPVMGSSCRNIAMPFDTEKQMVKNNVKIYLFVLKECMNMIEKETDRHRMTAKAAA